MRKELEPAGLLSRRQLLLKGLRIAAGVSVGAALGWLSLACEEESDKLPTPASSKTENSPIFVPENYTSLRFLTNPFPNDSEIKIQQGWYYTFLDENGKPVEHQGIDFIKGEIDRSSTWQPFPVLAAADGWAWINPPSHIGNAVFIEHRANGQRIYTYYGHLQEMAALPPYLTYDNQHPQGQPIKRGEKIGVAGASGVVNEKGEPEPTWVHLHFQVNIGDIPFDPYDLRKQREEYPNANFSNGKLLGQNTLWKSGMVKQ